MTITKDTYKTFIEAADKGNIEAIIQLADQAEMVARQHTVRSQMLTCLKISIHYTQKAVERKNKAQHEKLLMRCHLYYFSAPASERARLLLGVWALKKFLYEGRKPLLKGGIVYLKGCIEAKDTYVSDESKKLMRRMGRLCGSCDNKYGTLLCSACGKTRYCSVECQKEHSRKHRIKCFTSMNVH